MHGLLCIEIVNSRTIRLASCFREYISCFFNGTILLFTRTVLEYRSSEPPIQMIKYLKNLFRCHWHCAQTKPCQWNDKSNFLHCFFKFFPKRGCFRKLLKCFFSWLGKNIFICKKNFFWRFVNFFSHILTSRSQTFYVY